jgi:hypothetical protein
MQEFEHQAEFPGLGLGQPAVPAPDVLESGEQLVGRIGAVVGVCEDLGSLAQDRAKVHSRDVPLPGRVAFQPVPVRVQVSGHILQVVQGNTDGEDDAEGVVDGRVGEEFLPGRFPPAREGYLGPQLVHHGD